MLLAGINNNKKQKGGKGVSKKKRNHNGLDLNGMTQPMRNWAKMMERLEPKPQKAVKNGGKKNNKK